MSPYAFTFAIVNWNTRDLLDQCLASIYSERGDFPIQILVADNASGDGSAEMVEAKYPEVELVRHERNLGFAGGHEALFERSRGRYHVLVNSDVRFLPGCLENLDRRMREEPDIGILGCRIIGPDGKTQPCCRRFPSLWFQWVEASGLNRLFPDNRFINAYKLGGFDHQSSREVEQVIGALFLIRRELLAEIGFLDTAFHMYFEEVDYCLRAHRAGWRIFYEADARVWHEGGGSSKMVKVLTIRRTMRSMRHYFKKHRGSWTYLPLMAIVSLDLVTHSLYALLTWNKPLLTLRAYALGWWDLFTLKKANH